MPPTSVRRMQVTQEVVVNFETKLVDGLHKGLISWAKSPGALTVARNGGAESALRAHLLHYLEEATSCIAFTEGDRKRIDVTLRPKRSPDKEVVLIEFKNNLLHPHQQRYIRNSRLKAVEQLQGADVQVGTITGRYYLHFVIELCIDAATNETASSMSVGHNKLVPPYKRFLPANVLHEELCHVRAIFKAPPARYRISENPELPTAPATLYCWIFSVPQKGKATPIERLSKLAPST